MRGPGRRKGGKKEEEEEEERRSRKGPKGEQEKTLALADYPLEPIVGRVSCCLQVPECMLVVFSGV